MALGIRKVESLPKQKQKDFPFQSFHFSFVAGEKITDYPQITPITQKTFLGKTRLPETN
jgi:hypothetical protein